MQAVYELILMFNLLNRNSMKQLCEDLQKEFGDSVICEVSPLSLSVHIFPSLVHDFFSQCDILMITKYCLAHFLDFYFDCGRGCIVVYPSLVLAHINKHK